MSENQLALTSLVTTLGAIQEEVRTVRVLFSKQQANTFQIAPPTAAVSIIKPARQQQPQQQQLQVPATQKPASQAADSAAATGKDARSPKPKQKPLAVSYTHLTLPTKRIV